jgi:hypothetical protein
MDWTQIGAWAEVALEHIFFNWPKVKTSLEPTFNHFTYNLDFWLLLENDSAFGITRLVAELHHSGEEVLIVTWPCWAL